MIKNTKTCKLYIHIIAEVMLAAVVILYFVVGPWSSFLLLFLAGLSIYIEFYLGKGFDVVSSYANQFEGQTKKVMKGWIQEAKDIIYLYGDAFVMLLAWVAAKARNTLPISPEIMLVLLLFFVYILFLKEISVFFPLYKYIR